MRSVVFFILRNIIATVFQFDHSLFTGFVTDVRKVTIVVTDGCSGIGREIVKKRAEVMKSRGIEMFAVGITNRMKEEELKVLSSKPVKHHLFKITDSKILKDIVDSLVKQVCK